MFRVKFGYEITDEFRQVQFTTRRGRLRFTPELLGSAVWIDPAPQRWARFWSDVELADVWNWDPTYFEFTGEEGVFWTLDLIHGERRIESAGYTTFPRNFPVFCRALEELADRELFTDWDRGIHAQFRARGPESAQARSPDVKKRRIFVVDRPDDTDPIEDWQDYLADLIKLPPGCYESAIIEAEEKIRELKLAQKPAGFEHAGRQ